MPPLPHVLLFVPRLLIVQRFVVIVSTRDLARKVFNSPMYVNPCVVDAAKKILRPENWVFLDGKAHVDYRKGLNGLFHRKNLAMYLPKQEEVYDQYFRRWLELSKDGCPRQYMGEFRDINCAVSLRTFCGRYITDESVADISENYYKITAALELVNFPIIIPFTKTWYGKKCADHVLAEFSRCARLSKEAMEAGGEPQCTMDFWVLSMIESRRFEQLSAAEKEAHAGPKPMTIRQFSDLEIAMTVFTFLFASQDASSSASTWQFQILADRPDILAKVRDEQLRVRDGDPYKRLDIDMVDRMVYTRAVVKEQLRYRPPVLMVPYEVKKSFNVTPDYRVPKGAMIIPTTYPALHDPDVYVDPESFNPDRWLDGGEAEAATKNWLVFGTGPHVCLGQHVGSPPPRSSCRAGADLTQQYAIMNFMSMIGKASLFLDWEHMPTPLSEEIKVFATIFPQVTAPCFALSTTALIDARTTVILLSRNDCLSPSPRDQWRPS